jgi:hypothetical protein
MPEDLKDQNGSKKGLTALLDEVKGEVKVLKEKGVEDVKALQDPEKTQLYKSIFRVKHDDKPRSRALGVLSNVFLHLHPCQDQPRRGGLQLYLGNGRHHVLPVCGADVHRTLLMFYYHPTKVQGVSRHSLSWSMTFPSESSFGICIAGQRT